MRIILLIAKAYRKSVGKRNNFVDATLFLARTKVSDDPQSIESHMKGLENELKKAKPRDHLLLPLMKSMFSVRRDWIVDGAESVASILK